MLNKVIFQSWRINLKFSCSTDLQWQACDEASFSSPSTGAPSGGCWWYNPPERTPACRSAASPTTADPRARPSHGSRSSGSFRDRRAVYLSWTRWETASTMWLLARRWNPPGLRWNDRRQTSFVLIWVCRLRVPHCGSRRVRRRSSEFYAPTWQTCPARSPWGGTRPRASPRSLRSEKDRDESEYQYMSDSFQLMVMHARAPVRTPPPLKSPAGLFYNRTIHSVLNKMAKVETVHLHQAFQALCCRSLSFTDSHPLLIRDLLSFRHGAKVS